MLNTAKYPKRKARALKGPGVSSLATDQQY